MYSSYNILRPGWVNFVKGKLQTFILHLQLFKQDMSFSSIGTPIVDFIKH